MRAVGYCRLSRDEEKENNTSIENQKQLILDYAKKNNLIITRFYIDDNISGFNFDRPGWTSMMNDIDKIDIIIAKDLSRIGRNNGRTLVILEDLKELGKNLVTLNWNADEDYNLQKDDGEIVGITTWANERLVRDTSKKVKAVFRNKQKNGTLIMGKRYGYIRDKKDKTKLLVDEEVRPVINEIFSLYTKKKMGYIPICDALNKKGYLTPSQHIQKRLFLEGKEYKGKVQNKWCTFMIQDIIENECYVGTLVTHKKECQIIKGKSKKVPKSEQHVFYNHHEAIVSMNIFELAQRIKKKRMNEKTCFNNQSFLFRSLIVCGNCGFAVSGKTIKRAKGNIICYGCTDYIKYGTKRCNCGYIKENYLVLLIKQILQDTRNQYYEILNVIKVEKYNDKKENILQKLNQELNNKKCQMQMYLIQKTENLSNEIDIVKKGILEENYNVLIDLRVSEITDLNNKIKEIKEIKKDKAIENIQTILDKFDYLINAENPDRYTLDSLINKIYLYPDKSLKIDLRVNIDELCI